MSTATELRRLKREFGALLDSHDRGRDLDDLAEYADRPVAFLREVLDADPWTAQEAIAGSVRDNRRTLVQSAHAVGKDWLAARLALWWAYAKRGLVIVSGPTERQVREIVFGEVRKAWTRAGDLPGERYSLALRIPGYPGMIGFTATSDSAFTGFHDPNLLVILTEAQGLEDWTFQAAAACATGEGSRILAVGNPLEPSGPFFRASQVGNWSRFKIPAFEHPNVIEGREIIPGAVTRDWVEEMADDYGRESTPTAPGFSPSSPTGRTRASSVARGSTRPSSERRRVPAPPSSPSIPPGPDATPRSSRSVEDRPSSNSSRCRAATSWRRRATSSRSCTGSASNRGSRPSRSRTRAATPSAA